MLKCFLPDEKEQLYFPSQPDANLFMTMAMSWRCIVLAAAVDCKWSLGLRDVWLEDDGGLLLFIITSFTLM